MASRTQNFIRSLGAGYISVAVNIAYTAASVPLALHYLGKEQFGLWALAQQIMGYLILLDLGVSSAVARFVADYKDDVQGGEYGRLLLTGAMVFAVQGVLIAAAGAGFAFFAPFLFAVPDHLACDFTNVLIIITFFAGLSVSLRTIGAPLWAFQRIDLLYTLGSLALVSGFSALWLGFSLGWGIYSLALSGIPAALFCPVITFFFCKKNGLYPASRSGWLIPRLSDFRRIFAFGKDAALMSLGAQLVSASQIMIISRFVGLESAATFSIATKIYSLGQQLVAKVEGTSAPALTELFVRGERDRFNARFLDVVSVSTFMATFIAVLLVSGNTFIVSIWTLGMIRWNRWGDILLAALLLLNSVTRCMNELFVFRGNLKSVRYIYLLEGLVFVSLAVPVVTLFGIVGLLTLSLLVHLAVNFRLTLKASNEILPIAPIVKQTLKSFSVVVVYFVFLGEYCLRILALGPAVFFLLLIMLSAGLLSWYFLLGRTLRAELLHRMGIAKWF